MSESDDGNLFSPPPAQGAGASRRSLESPPTPSHVDGPGGHVTPSIKAEPAGGDFWSSAGNAVKSGLSNVSSVFGL